MDNSLNRPHSRASTRAGIHAAPPPLYSPSRMLFGSIEAGAEPDSPSAINNPPSLRRRDPSLRRRDRTTPSQDETFAAAAQREPEGWTTVTHRISRTHREYGTSYPSNYTRNFASERADSESTIARTTANLNGEELSNLARRHKAFAAQYQAASDRKRAIEAAREGQDIDSSDIEGVCQDRGESVNPAGRAPSSHRTMVEKVEEQDNIVSSTPAVPRGYVYSRNIGKGAYSGNWGDVSLRENFAESNLKAQQDELENFAEIHHVEKHERVTTPCEVLVDVSLPCRPKSEAEKAKSPSKALTSDGKTPRSDKKASKSKLAAPKLKPQEVHEVEPQSRPKASGRDSKTDRENMSGQTHLTAEEMLSLLDQKISELEAARRDELTHGDQRRTGLEVLDDPKLRGVTPGR
ncbi:hypothetical protein B0H13DRAFT_2301521 [Mycena leptocephala]|nr:hypothetical protein B0H13DRAFT_2301521 [Mycena leptocephala]